MMYRSFYFEQNKRHREGGGRERAREIVKAYLSHLSLSHSVSVSIKHTYSDSHIPTLMLISFTYTHTYIPTLCLFSGPNRLIGSQHTNTHTQRNVLRGARGVRYLQ